MAGLFKSPTIWILKVANINCHSGESLHSRVNDGFV